MLTATSQTQFGEARIASALVLGALYRAQLVWRHDLLFDSRFSSPHRGTRALATVYLVHAGEVEVGDVTYAAPVALIASAREYERYEPGASYVRTWGDPCLTLDILLRVEHIRVPVALAHGPVEVSATTWAAVSSMAEAHAMGEPLSSPTQDVMRGLAADGVVAPELAETGGVESPSVERMWNALARHHDNWDTSIQLADLAEQAAMSSRQLSRDAQSLLERVALDDVRFRDVVVAVRLRLAALLLSAREATIAEVAQRVGYGSVDALGRAFRDAGLPPPHAIRELVISPRTR